MSEPALASAVPVPVPRREVLLVEPSRTLRRVYAERCRAVGLEPVEVEGTLEALAQVTRRRPAAILCSLEQEDLPGGSLVAALKSSREHAAIPVVVLTSREEARTHFRGPAPDLVLRKLGNLRGALDDFFLSLGLGGELGDDDALPLYGMHLLVAEDSKVQQRFLAQLLHVAGARVELAATGLEAVELALGGDYDLVLMDLEMPELDGFEAAEQLRAAGVTTPLIACTALPDGGELTERAAAAGFLQLVPKPVDRDTLIDLCLDHHPG